MEIYIISPACSHHLFMTSPTSLQLYASKATLDPHSSFFLHILLRGYPQWKELLLPVLKHQLGSLRLGAVRWERRNSQLVITALWGFLLRRQRARGNKVSGGKRGVWCLKWKIKWRKRWLEESWSRNVLVYNKQTQINIWFISVVNHI